MKKMKATEIEAELARAASDSDAVFLQRFFKTGPGEYGEGDQFIGVRVPSTRKVCRQFKEINLSEVKKLIQSPIHEHRLCGLIILTLKYPKADQELKENIYKLYMDSVYEGRVNNWDLVDLSADKIVGPFVEGDRRILYELAKSNNLWQKRVSILSTFYYIKNGDGSTTLDLAKIMLHDKHDLIHKAVGWMLREVGKRIDEELLTNFLDKHAHEMPRTALRYSLEKLSAEKKKHYMAK